MRKRYYIIAGVVGCVVLVAGIWLVQCAKTNAGIRRLNANIARAERKLDEIRIESNARSPSDIDQAFDWISRRPTRLMALDQEIKDIETRLPSFGSTAILLQNRLDELHAIRKDKISDMLDSEKTIEPLKSQLRKELCLFSEYAPDILHEKRATVWARLFNQGNVRNDVDLEAVGAAARDMGQIVKVSMTISDETKQCVSKLNVQDIGGIKTGLKSIEQVGRDCALKARGLAVVYSDGVRAHSEISSHFHDGEIE